MRQLILSSAILVSGFVLASTAPCAGTNTDEATLVAGEFMVLVTSAELHRGGERHTYVLPVDASRRLDQLMTRRLASELGDPSTPEFFDALEALADVRGIPPGFKILDATRDGDAVEVRTALCYPQYPGETALRVVASDVGWLVDDIEAAHEVPPGVCG
jgi:hypothetical protein